MTLSCKYFTESLLYLQHIYPFHYILLRSPPSVQSTSHKTKLRSTVTENKNNLYNSKNFPSVFPHAYTLSRCKFLSIRDEICSFSKRIKLVFLSISMSYILTIPLIYGVQKVKFKELCLDIQASLGQFLRSIKIVSRKRMKGEKRQRVWVK